MVIRVCSSQHGSQWWDVSDFVPNIVNWFDDYSLPVVHSGAIFVAIKENSLEHPPSLPSSLPPDDYQENLDKRSREKIKQKLIMCLCFREWQCDFHSNWLFLYWFENGIKALQAKPNLHHHSSSLVLACNPPRVPSLQKSSLSRYCPESIESDNILIIMSSWNNSPSSPLSVGAKKWVPRLLIIARALINSCQFLFEV